MPRKGINPDRDTWQAKLPIPLRARMESIKFHLEADAGRQVMWSEVFEYLVEQEEARQP